MNDQRIFATWQGKPLLSGMVVAMTIVMLLAAGLTAREAAAEVRIGKIAVSATVLSSCRLDVQSTALQAARLLSGQDTAHRSQCNGNTMPAHRAVLEPAAGSGALQYATASVLPGAVTMTASGAQAMRIRYDINY